MNLKLRDEQIDATTEARAAVLHILKVAKQRPTFGNGGEIENVLSRVKANHQTRMSNIPPDERPTRMVLEPSDIDPNADRSSKAADNIASLFKDFVGSKSPVAQFQTFARVTKAMRDRGLDPKGIIPFGFVFKGPPGTGKTTTARKIGQIFYDLGFLSTTDVIEASVNDMSSQWIGGTTIKTRELLESALGKVLIIDEAYRLGESAREIEMTP